MADGIANFAAHYFKAVTRHRKVLACRKERGRVPISYLLNNGTFDIALAEGKKLHIS